VHAADKDSVLYRGGHVMSRASETIPARKSDRAIAENNRAALEGIAEGVAMWKKNCGHIQSRFRSCTQTLRIAVGKLSERKRVMSMEHATLRKLGDAGVRGLRV
jgi:hypothetical protein